MENPRIPIENIYYLLCYAWNQLKQGELINVTRIPSTELVDLFALILIDGTKHLAKRGLEQGYESLEDEVCGAKGRINVAVTARKFLPIHGRTHCQFDEISSNTLPNRILKSTLHNLTKIQNMNRELRANANAIVRELNSINFMQLNQQCFRRVQIHSNNRFYRFLMNVCELIYNHSLVDQKSGNNQFRDFVRDERAMARVFQNFLYNFLKSELLGSDVRREHIHWQADSATDPELLLLPRMETDITIRKGNSQLIVDTKYYQNPLRTYYSTEKMHGENLFQLMSYLINSKVSDQKNLSGMLIYPRIDKTIRVNYRILGLPVAVATLDLNQNWKLIKEEIFEIISFGLDAQPLH